jgi:CRISPR-associated endonuclease Cas2
METLEDLIPKGKRIKLQRQMYVLVFYDVERARIEKVSSFLREYLKCREDCIFEGKLTKSKLDQVITGLKNIISENRDGILIFYKEVGKDKESVLVISRIRSEDDRVLESHEIGLGKVPTPLFVQPIGAWQEKETLKNIVLALTWKSIGL